MSTATDNLTRPVLDCREVSRAFKRDTGELVQALDRVSVEAHAGTLTALVGPDGAGKTTLIRHIGGLLMPDSGSVHVTGVDVRRDPQLVQSRIGYMPQRFGLYEDLSVRENLDLYADLHGVTRQQRAERYPRLMEMTQLGRFTARLAGRLSGGMKQKLGLACTLVRLPDLLVLDEPTVGVDPVSRRELWAIILQLVREERLPVLVSTSYLDEAERCDRVLLMHQGKVIGRGTPAEVRAAAARRTFRLTPRPGVRPRQVQARLMHDPAVVDAVPEGGRVRFVTTAPDARPDLAIATGEPEPAEPRFEDGFMVKLREAAGEHHHGGAVALGEGEAAEVRGAGEVVVEVRDLVKKFGEFAAVDHISFQVRRGEIFGLLGPNGAGKSTTFRMLCGLMPATGGTLHIAGTDVRKARASARQRLGYVAQKFALYPHLTVMENLKFFSAAYGLRGARQRTQIATVLEQFELTDRTGQTAGLLPGGFKQRLAMAAALMHEPEILFLDEPTSGVDPLARREFWQRITGVAERGVTVIVTTHFMEEAEYCDRMVILVAGRILAEGTPADVRHRARPQPGCEATIEDAFIAVVEDSRKDAAADTKEVAA
jgi:ABC-2 type transport system ATP-binding protein